jgi:ferritin-like metal-binding protein YciE
MPSANRYGISGAPQSAPALTSCGTSPCGAGSHREVGAEPPPGRQVRGPAPAPPQREPKGEHAMKIDSLKDLYIAELQEARSFEGQIANALRGLADRARHPDLKEMLAEDKPESLRHGEQVTAILDRHGVDPRAHTDQTMQTVLAEAQKWADEIDDPDVRDAAIIAAVQRVQHYEIAAYGALAAWAKRLGLEDLETLHEILEEEKAADGKLNTLAKEKVNAEAV